MIPTIQSAKILQTIQAAVAPVVLISGVGLLLLTLTTRLGRIVDRSRLLSKERRTLAAADPALDEQLAILSRRARMVRLAVALSAFAVAVIGVLVMVLFLGALFRWDVTLPSIALFVVAMLSLVGAMLVFVRELFLALAALDVELGKP
jgi:hypothetical protein